MCLTIWEHVSTVGCSVPGHVVTQCERCSAVWCARGTSSPKGNRSCRLLHLLLPCLLSLTFFLNPPRLRPVQTYRALPRERRLRQLLVSGRGSQAGRTNIKGKQRPWLPALGPCQTVGAATAAASPLAPAPPAAAATPLAAAAPSLAAATPLAAAAAPQAATAAVAAAAPQAAAAAPLATAAFAFPPSSCTLPPSS